jgi:Porin subfamily
MSKSIFTALAFIVSFAAASAAELPGQRDKIPEKAKKCDIGGVAGVMLPGTETCVKISGGVTVEAIGANRKPIGAANGQ